MTEEAIAQLRAVRARALGSGGRMNHDILEAAAMLDIPPARIQDAACHSPYSTAQIILWLQAGWTIEQIEQYPHGVWHAWAMGLPSAAAYRRACDRNGGEVVD